MQVTAVSYNCSGITPPEERRALIRPVYVDLISQFVSSCGVGWFSSCSNCGVGKDAPSLLLPFRRGRIRGQERSETEGAVQIVHLDSALLPRDYFMFFPILCTVQYIADLDE